ncbi:MAG: ABC transporter ATP-binding protein [Chloroflexota bacterium]
MITLEHVSRSFSSGTDVVRAVDDVSLEVAPGELCVLIGPSGSGKTTTMRMINRLDAPTEGKIIVNGRDISTVNDVELRRGIGYVIQQGGLLPHITVADNVSIVPRLMRKPKKQRRERAEELLALVGLPPKQFANRYPRQLSGGQQQRVGVARALASDPPIILMDEPFGAVDPITRKQLQFELRRIQSEVKKTIVFVTHDIAEAFVLGDRIVLMLDGRIVQDGTPADLLRRPANDFVTSFIGEDRVLRTWQYTTLAEIARPAAGAPPAGGQILRSDLTVFEGLQSLASNGQADGDGMWVSDAEGKPSGYLTYNDLVGVMSATMAEGPATNEGMAHALPPQ